MPEPTANQGSDALGREAELALIDRFLEDVPTGARGLLFEGEAGIGKTTLWERAIAVARSSGHRVLACRPTESETALSLAALGDLLEDELDHVLPELPAPQRRALDVALLREEATGPSPDQRAVSLATLGALRALAASAPLILAVDDVQWIDRPSARVLSFAVRRLGDEPVGVVVAQRLGEELIDPIGLERLLPDPRFVRSRVGDES